MTYRYLQDPGHGWIEVPVAELAALGIADRITHYSYISRDGTLAYLEEDCDASTWHDAAVRVGKFPDLVEVVEPRADSFVRGLRPYPEHPNVGRARARGFAALNAYLTAADGVSHDD